DRFELVDIVFFFEARDFVAEVQDGGAFVRLHPAIDFFRGRCDWFLAVRGVLALPWLRDRRGFLGRYRFVARSVGRSGLRDQLSRRLAFDKDLDWCRRLRRDLDRRRRLRRDLDRRRRLRRGGLGGGRFGLGEYRLELGDRFY